jgi:hypothetical protein
MNIDYSQFRTGDLYVNSSDGLLASVIKHITFSDYNHTTLCIRLDPSYFPKIKIVRDGGKMFILELIKSLKYPKMYLRESRYTNFKLLRFPLKDIYYTSDFVNRLTRFIESNCVKIELYDWTTYEIQQDNNIINDFKLRKSNLATSIGSICSELTYSVYKYCLPSIVKDINKTLLIPGHYTENNNSNPLKDLFNSKIQIQNNDVYNNSYNVILPVIFLILLFAALLYYKTKIFLILILILLLIWLIFVIYYKYQ